jgi:ABC-type antimicrobial peptide transport system permease subunit
LKPDEEREVWFNFVKHDFTKTYGIEIVEGRDFDASFGTDEQLGCLINETLARSMNQDPIIGSRINIWDQDRKVIGVMKDFNFQPLEAPLTPLAVMMIPKDESVFAQTNTMSIRINPGDPRSTLNYIESTWNKVVPDHPFEYSFLDQEFDANYRSLEQVNNLAVCFGLLAVFIAALGLFGLASFTAEQRTNEIGIRKVLGASVASIVRMMSREYVMLVGISNLVAWPVAWYIMRDWLQGFAYHVNIGIGVFIAVGCFTLAVALLSVGYQALRAASINPVDAIQYE